MKLNFNPAEVLIVVCAYDAKDFEKYTKGLIKELMGEGFGGYNVELGPLLELNRNLVIDKTMTTENKRLKQFKKILHLDIDCEPTKEQIYTLLNYNLPIVSGWYELNGDTSRVCVLDKDGNNFYKDNLPSGVHPAHSVGLGCFVCDGDVYDTIPKPWFECHWIKTDKGRLKYLSEDFVFCAKAKFHKFQIHVDFDMKIEHRTRYKNELAKTYIVE